MQSPPGYAAAASLFLLATFAATFSTTPASAVALADNGYMPFGPNLSYCHASFSDAGAPLYCCPNPPESSEQIVDFDLEAVATEASIRPLRLRRPAHVMSLDPDYVAKYERSVELMKALPEDHPHNYRRQANMHCIYCTGSYDQVNSGYVFKIHNSWFFFVWHRAFLYFHERTLAKLIGDDSFALPYWQWDSPDGMKIPDMYVKGVNNSSLDHHDRDRSHLPPSITINDFIAAETGLSPVEQIDYNLAFMYHQMVSVASKPELFMGCRLHPGKEETCNGPGTMETAPHNALHTWVGSNLQPEREDMGAFYSAARDPLFYAHHSNIDRLWTVWRKLHGDRKEFVDPLWLDTQFYFHDEDMRLVRVKVRDFLDISKLGYAYEEANMPWLNARPKPFVDRRVANHLLWEKKEQHLNQLYQQKNHFSVSAFLRMMFGLLPKQQLPEIPLVDFGSDGRRLNCSFTVLVPRTRDTDQRQLAGADLRRELVNSADSIPAGRNVTSDYDKPEEVLVVYGIDNKKDMYVKFNVYINVPDYAQATVFAAGPRAREFAGTYIRMRMGIKVFRPRGKSFQNAKTVLKLGISELLRDLQAEEDDAIWVTIVPVAGTGDFTTLQGIRIDNMGWWG